MGITRSHSRRYTSTDNPYLEAHFKTLKYRPKFPDRFDDTEQARAFCRGFFHWYNHEHRHSGIGLMTPAAVHHGEAQQLHAARVLEAGYARNPERFVRRAPVPPELPTAPWINKPNTKGGRSLNSKSATVSFDLTGSGRSTLVRPGSRLRGCSHTRRITVVGQRRSSRAARSVGQ